jgi:lactoylglutathione lyase
MKIRASAIVGCLVLFCSEAGLAQSAAQSTVAKSASPQFGYVSLKVGELQRSLKFYTEVLGMTEGRHLNGGSGVTEVLMGYGTPQKEPGVMLMFDEKRTKPYELGDGLSRFIVYVPDLEAMSKKVAAANATVIRGITRIASINISVMLIKDPDGYVIELVQRG